MQLPWVLIFAAFVFAAQLLLCFEAKKEWLRILPLSLSVGFETLCWIFFFLGKLIRMEASVSFPTFILGYIGLYWFLAPLAAWATYALVKFVQNRRK